MDLSRRDLGNVTVLDLSGKLTINDGAGRLKDTVTSLIAAGQKNIILNLGNLTYMDSAGLGEMVACSLDRRKKRRRREAREHHRQDEGSARRSPSSSPCSTPTTPKRRRSAASNSRAPADLTAVMIHRSRWSLLLRPGTLAHQRACRRAAASPTPSEFEADRGAREREDAGIRVPGVARRHRSTTGGHGARARRDQRRGSAADHRPHRLSDRVHLENLCRDRDDAAGRAGQGRPAARRCRNICPSSASRTRR